MAGSLAAHGLLFYALPDLPSGSSERVRASPMVVELVAVSSNHEASVPEKRLGRAEPLAAHAARQLKPRIPAPRPKVFESSGESGTHTAHPETKWSIHKNVDSGLSAAGGKGKAKAQRPARASGGSEDRFREVRAWLERYKYYPLSARRRGIEGEVHLAFELAKGGKVDHVAIVRGSGYAVLDRAALNTVRRAQPFPVETGAYQVRLRFRQL